MVWVDRGSQVSCMPSSNCGRIHWISATEWYELNWCNITWSRLVRDVSWVILIFEECKHLIPTYILTPVSGAAPISVGSNSTDQSGFETLMALLGIAHNPLKPHHNLSVKSVVIDRIICVHLCADMWYYSGYWLSVLHQSAHCAPSLTLLYSTVRWIAWRWHPTVLPRNSSCGADHSYSTTTKSCR